MTEKTTPIPDKNQHITEYLTYYINKEEPADSAILLTGSWGCGKTYFIDQFIENIRQEESKKVEDQQQRYIFKISVFGLKTITDLDNQISQEICYVLGALGQGARIAGKALTMAGTIWNALDTPIKFKKDKLKEASEKLSKQLEKLLLKNNKSTITYVFDDLERTDIPLKELLGHINAFVERDHIKVILIANEVEITHINQIKQEDENETLDDKTLSKYFGSEDQEEVKPPEETSSPSPIESISKKARNNIATYTKFKEKVIGKTFEIQSDFDNVLNLFIETHQYKNLLSPHLDIIKSRYLSHETNNFRHLKQSLDDFRYLLNHLNETHRKNKIFIKDLISNFFDLKLNILNNNSIKSISNNIYTQDVWIRFLLKNDYVDIQEKTNHSHYFIPEPKQPLWMRLHFFPSLENKDFNDLSQKLINNFNSLKEEGYYEYFHTLGLMIEWSKKELINETIKDIKKKADDYLKEHSPNWSKKYDKEWQNLRLDQSVEFNANNKTGYVYYSHEDPFFKRIWNCFFEKQKEAYNKIQEQTLESNILEAMQEKGNVLLRDILLVDKHKPIFNQIDPESFFQTLLLLNNLQLFKVNYCIDNRYLNNKFSLNKEITELHFWQEIEKKLTKHLNENQNLGSITQYNFQNLLKTVKKLLDKIEKNNSNN